MNHASFEHLLDAALNAWDCHNIVMLNLLRALPDGGLEARAAADSPTVAEMFTHMHHERMVSVEENAREQAGATPAGEWVAERDREAIARMLEDSASRVRAAVQGRVRAGLPLDRAFPHPVQFLMFLIFHEGYHHGQIKLALKRVGSPMADADAGPLTWRVWRARDQQSVPDRWQAPDLVPSLACQDVPAAVDFLTRAFGFRERTEARLSWEGGCRAWVELGGVLVTLASSGGHGLEAPRAAGGVSMALKVYVADVDAHFRQARAAGAAILSEPEDGFWGGRIYRALDSEGHHWEFAQAGRDRDARSWQLPPGISMGTHTRSDAK
jgi:uncharacterized glyoxalase superfamily protein PhnB/uncharacterized damage-inducible protein DinB